MACARPAEVVGHPLVEPRLLARLRPCSTEVLDRLAGGPLEDVHGALAPSKIPGLDDLRQRRARDEREQTRIASLRAALSEEDFAGLDVHIGPLEELHLATDATP